MLPVVGAVRPRATAAIAGRSFATQTTRGLRSYRPNSVLGGKRKEPRLKMEAQMAIPQWHDLTQEEQQALAARAQQGVPVRRIGVLMAYAESDPEAQARIGAVRQGLRELGWTEGHNLRMEIRWGTGDPDRARTSTTELI